MLKKLRRRFMLITMGLIAAVLIAVLTASVISTYQTQYNRIQNALSNALFSGRDPGMIWVGPAPSRPDGSESSPSVTYSSPGWGIRAGNSVDTYNDIPVFVIVKIAGRSGTTIIESVVSMDADLVAAALERLEPIIKTGEMSPPYQTRGLLSDLGLYYLVTVSSTPFGLETRIAFASSTPLINSTLHQAAISAIILVVALLVLFGISLFLSRMALRPVEEAWEKQRHFIANASHELKTPLTVILANNNLLRSHATSTVADQMQWVDSTQIEAQRMDGLVRDLLLLAQTDEQEAAGGKAGLGGKIAAGGKGTAGGKASTTMSAEGSDCKTSESSQTASHIDLSALTNSVLLQFDAVFFERGRTLKSAIADSIIVNGISEQLDRVICILLDNASKYSEPDSIVCVVLENIQDQKGRPFAQLTVTNNGVPIEVDKLPYVFDRFYRADEAHSESIEGYGLGLSLAKGIVEGHGGTITVTSTAEGGTTFTVQLPSGDRS